MFCRPMSEFSGSIVDEEVKHDPQADEQPLHIPAGFARILDLRRHGVHSRTVSVQLVLQFPVCPAGL